MEVSTHKTRCCLYVSDSAVKKIIAKAATSVDGVAGDTKSPSSRIKTHVLLDGDVLSITLEACLLQGFGVIEVCEAVQSKVKSAVQNLLGLTVARVNVKVIDILK